MINKDDQLHYPDGTIRLIEKRKLFRKPIKVKQICEMKFSCYDGAFYYNNWIDIYDKNIIREQKLKKLNKL